MKKMLVFLFSLQLLQATAQPPQLPVDTMFPTRQTPVHDPVMTKEGDTYYLFCTGMGISVWSSKDLKSWRKEAPVFASAPQWAIAAVPGFKGHIWAPDISYYNGQYYLYYSVSAFGKNTSCIGLATAKILDSASAGFGWTDHGKIIQSYPGKTNWNAIDPNLITGSDGTPYLIFGSFWDGLKITKLTPDRMHIAGDSIQLPTIASRKEEGSSATNPPAVGDNPVDAGGNAIEAPFAFKKGGYYYLFASWDYCCRAEKSTYKVVVGRSKDAAGPYLDKSGKRMDQNGGTVVVEGDNKQWFGAGHNSVYTFNGKDYNLYHGYDAADKGRSKLIIKELLWDADGWPVFTKEK